MQYIVSNGLVSILTYFSLFPGRICFLLFFSLKIEPASRTLPGEASDAMVPYQSCADSTWPR